jgi:hypothetical protein
VLPHSRWSAWVFVARRSQAYPAVVCPDFAAWWRWPRPAALRATVGATTALEVRAVLTPDQLATAAQDQKQLEQIHGEMSLIMGPPPGAP